MPQNRRERDASTHSCRGHSVSAGGEGNAG